MSYDLQSVKKLIQTNEEYKKERNAIFEWAEDEDKKNDKENPCTGQSQDGPHSARQRAISIELNRRLADLNKKYGLQEK